VLVRRRRLRRALTRGTCSLRKSQRNRRRRSHRRSRLSRGSSSHSSSSLLGKTTGARPSKCLKQSKPKALVAVATTRGSKSRRALALAARVWCERRWLHLLGLSFGSICLGSLLVALLSTAETVVKYCRDSCGADAAQGDPEAGLCYVCLCCLGLVLNVLRDLLEYFNRWAFTYVAVYGDSFVSAGKSTHALFKRRAWSSIVSDTLCSLSLSLASLALAVLLGLGAFVCASLLLSPEARGAVALAAFLSAYVVCSCVVSVLDAGVLTVVVCFAEDPFAGLASHPEEFGRLMETWRHFFGPELEASGYDRLF